MYKEKDNHSTRGRNTVFEKYGKIMTRTGPGPRPHARGGVSSESSDPFNRRVFSSTSFRIFLESNKFIACND